MYLTRGTQLYLYYINYNYIFIIFLITTFVGTIKPPSISSHQKLQEILCLIGYYNIFLPQHITNLNDPQMRLAIKNCFLDYCGIKVMMLLTSLALNYFPKCSANHVLNTTDFV